MGRRRQAPVRVLERSPLLGPDRLDRGLGRVVEAARAEQAALARSAGSAGSAAARLAALEPRARGEGLEAVLPAALAAAAAAAHALVGLEHEVCGEAARWELSPRDNQLACAVVLARGEIAELDTGEGKTLAVALAAVCLALRGRVHVVTANDYLARRDHEWMSPLFEALGIETGLVREGSPEADRRRAYSRRITYVSVKELGADYLRDTLSSDPGELRLPALDMALLDEVDFILVDEARVPLILAEMTGPSDNLCHQFNDAVVELVSDQRRRLEAIHEELDRVEVEPGWSEQKRRFERDVRLAELLLAEPLDPRLAERLADAVEAGDGGAVRRVKDTVLRYQRAKRREELVEDLLYEVDRRAMAVKLTETGLDRLAELFGDLFLEPGDEPEAQLVLRARLRAVHNLIAAHVLHRRDRDYIVRDGRVVLVDQATGRPSPDRHLQHGLHRAIEAKEGLYPALDHRTAAEITFPGLFELYRSFGGTSGTCLELSAAFRAEHRKRVRRIPPHRPVLRADFEDALFATGEEKLEALLAEVALARKLLQPVLVGTDSVEQSEAVGAALRAAGVEHEVLNARHHEREARIIARAGEPGAVTVATIMAGRGTDIRVPEDLPRAIADAAAVWAEGLVAEQGGARLEVRSELEREVLLEALRRRALAPRVSRRQGAATVVDLGVPPPTAFPLTLGLRVIGFERLSEPRLDRQLRGRTGRQGAPGSSRFYLALDDETVLVHGDRARLAELARRASAREDPLSGRTVRSLRRLTEEVQRAWAVLGLQMARQRERLGKLDAVDQAQREHYDAERRSLLHASDETVSRLAEKAVARAARDVVAEVAGAAEHLTDEMLGALDDLTEVLFERRGLLAGLAEGDRWVPASTAAAGLTEALLAICSVARARHGPEAMARVERAVLLDALTESWRRLAAERPELREQAELYAYAGKQPEHVYRALAGRAYHTALAAAARTAASVLVTFPLPREIKTTRTGSLVEDADVLALVGDRAPRGG